MKRDNIEEISDLIANGMAYHINEKIKENRKNATELDIETYNNGCLHKITFKNPYILYIEGHKVEVYYIEVEEDIFEKRLQKTKLKVYYRSEISICLDIEDMENKYYDKTIDGIMNILSEISTCTNYHTAILFACHAKNYLGDEKIEFNEKEMNNGYYDLFISD